MIQIHCKYDELVSPKKLTNHPKNRNSHGQDQIERLAEIYQFQGIRHPIIVSNLSKCIVAGHGRKLAALRAGIKEFPVVYQDFESEEVEYSFIQSDNAIALWAELDEASIKLDLQALPDLDPKMLGLKEFHGEPLPTEGLTDPDEVPEKPEPVCKLGDLWQLGEHRLLCGDSTDLASVERLMGGAKAKMLHTDPPYGVDYEGVNNDHLKAEKLREFIYKALKCAFSCLEDASNVYVWHPDIHAYEFIGALRDAGFRQARPSTIQWVKNSLVLSQGDYHSRNEPCLYGWKPGSGRKRVEDRTQDTIWEYDKPKKSEDHPTMKPIELCERAINNSSEHGWIVLDLFLGSGSTLIACEKTKRKCYGMELDPHYCDVIISRWEQFTGQKAVKLESANG